MTLYFEKIFTIGKDAFFESLSITADYSVCFEDDTETGFFYALDMRRDSQVIDALHIYDVSYATGRNKSAKIQITWSNDGLIAYLLLNNYCHALFDFRQRAGYCRTGLPHPSGDWVVVKDRLLTEELIRSLQQ